MGPIGEDLENDERTKHRIGVDLVEAIQVAEHEGKDDFVMLLLELAECRLKSKGYQPADEGYVPDTPDLKVIK